MGGESEGWWWGRAGGEREGVVKGPGGVGWRAVRERGVWWRGRAGAQ
jgi:hypothetical protein